MRLALTGLALFSWLSAAPAAETVRLNGVNAPTTSLKGGSANDSETIQVFHKRRWCCDCCQPVVVASGCGGCYGGMGAGYSMAAPASYGYESMGFASSPYLPSPAYTYAAPRRSYQYAPAPTYTPPAPNYYEEPSRAIVTLPRLGLSFSLGGSNGLLASRAANRMVPQQQQQPREPLDVPPPAPQMPQGRPDQYRYDGGPANPIPMPGETPVTTPSLNNRVKAMPVKAGYLAYGERSNEIQRAGASSTTLVRGR